MKKLVLTLATISICTIAHAQEPEKKKSPPPTRGQERAINEVGVSVKSNPKKSTKSKSTKPAAPKEVKKKEEKSTEVKKPE